MKSYTYVVLLPDLDGRGVVFGLVGRPQEVDPDVPEAGLGAAALTEEVAAVEVEVVADPHDLAREVVGVHDEVRPVSRNGIKYSAQFPGEILKFTKTILSLGKFVEIIIDKITCKCWRWRARSPPSRAPRPCGASSCGSVLGLVKDLKFKFMAKVSSAKIPEHTVAGDVDAAHEPEVADCLVGVDVVAVGRDVAAKVLILAPRRHQV